MFCAEQLAVTACQTKVLCCMRLQRCTCVKCIARSQLRLSDVTGAEWCNIMIMAMVLQIEGIDNSLSLKTQSSRGLLHKCRHVTYWYTTIPVFAGKCAMPHQTWSKCQHAAHTRGEIQAIFACHTHSKYGLQQRYIIVCFWCLIVLHNRVAYLMSVESYPLGQVITQQGVAPVSGWHLSDISTHAHSDLTQLLLGQRRFCSINCVRK